MLNNYFKKINRCIIIIVEILSLVINMFIIFMFDVNSYVLLFYLIFFK